MAADAGYARPSTALEGNVIQSSEAASQRVGRSTDAGSPQATTESAGCSPSFRNRSYGATKVYNTEAMESVRLLAAGGVAGAVSKTCTAPLARLTILYQARLTCGCPHLPWPELMPWHAPGHELPQDDAKGVDVRGEGVTAARQDLRRQPAWVGGRHAAQDCTLFHDSRQVEITHLHIDETSASYPMQTQYQFDTSTHICSICSS